MMHMDLLDELKKAHKNDLNKLKADEFELKAEIRELKQEHREERKEMIREMRARGGMG